MSPLDLFVPALILVLSPVNMSPLDLFVPALVLVLSPVNTSPLDLFVSALIFSPSLAFCFFVCAKTFPWLYTFFNCPPRSIVKETSFFAGVHCKHLIAVLCHVCSDLCEYHLPRRHDNDYYRLRLTACVFKTNSTIYV